MINILGHVWPHSKCDETIYDVYDGANPVARCTPFSYGEKEKVDAVLFSTFQACDGAYVMWHPPHSTAPSLLSTSVNAHYV